MAAELGGALWLGNHNELGHTFWQTMDASAISAVAAQGMKYAFSRVRPDQGQGPNQWFPGALLPEFYWSTHAANPDIGPDPSARIQYRLFETFLDTSSSSIPRHRGGG